MTTVRRRFLADLALVSAEVSTTGTIRLLQGVVHHYCAAPVSRASRWGGATPSRWYGTVYATPASACPSKLKLVTLPTAHCRVLGLCHSGLCSAARRVTQMGSWWLTHTASWPAAASRARSTTRHTRSAT